MTSDPISARKHEATSKAIQDILLADPACFGRVTADSINAIAALVTTARGEDELRGLIAPFADYHGDLPDYDHPLRPTYESGIQYGVNLLAKELGVEKYQPCDGTEDFDGDLGGTLMNVVLEAMPKDKDGDPIHPRDLSAALASTDMAGVGENLTDRFWLIVREPGMMPDRKGPWPHRDTAKVMREFIAARPRAFLDVLTIGPDGTPDVEHGPQALQIADGRSMSVGRKHNARVRSATEEALAARAASQLDGLTSGEGRA